MLQDAQIAESSTANETVVPSLGESVPETQEQTVTAKEEFIPINEFTDAQRKEWLKTGEIPTRSKSPDATTGNPETSAPEVKADGNAVASESAPEKPKGKGAEARIQELLAERHKLRTEVETLKKSAQPAKPEAPPETPRQAEAVQVPKMSDFDTWEEYQEANSKYVIEQARREARAEFERQAKESSQQAEVKKLTEEWNSRVAKFKEIQPDFDDLKASESIPQAEKFAGFVVRSPYGPQIAHHLMTNLEFAERLAAADPMDMVRELVRLEVGFEAKQAQPKTAMKTTPVSKAAPPARDISNASTPVDELEAAAKSGDFERYMRLANAREAKRT